MEQRKTLLERYGVPINHLDFEYIKKCHDAREIEKIVQILRSGEEGYFPDLTTCAENRLKDLKPNSRLFRYEEALLSHDCLSAKEWQPVYDWADDIKTLDEKLAKLKLSDEGNGDSVDDLPPIRQVGKISQDTKEQTLTNVNTAGNAIRSATGERTKSTDYRKWDQYDADEELLRMDLAEERVSEDIERKNRLNMTVQNTKKSGIEPVAVAPALLSKLSDIEREKLAEEYRLRGNDYFRTKEYEAALAEYGRAIQMKPKAVAAVYNNRAITNIKMKKYAEAISDCEYCLELEPQNVKARLRLAEATYSYGRRRESYTIYEQVLELEPTNTVAQKAIADLRNLFGHLPPSNATRLKITESNKKTDKAQENPNKNIVVPPSPTPYVDYDLASLVRPNRVVTNKLAAAAQALSAMKPTPQRSDKSPEVKLLPTKTADATAPLELKSSNETMERAKQTGRLLIEEL